MISIFKSAFYHFIILISMIILVAACKKNPNSPPDMPELISPDNGLLGTFSDSLEWKCNDPDGDKLVYDVYFGKSNPPLFFKPNYKDNTLIVNDLDLDAYYYLSQG